MDYMNVDNINRMMNLYMMNSIMNIGMDSTKESSNTLGSNSILFEYILKNMIEQNSYGEKSNYQNTYHCTCCSNNVNKNLNVNTTNYDNVGKIDNKVNNKIDNNDYTPIGNFHPLGKAPTLSSRDINISPRIDSAIKEASSKYGVEESFVRAIIKQESSFNPNCTSKAGAKGLMQLMDYNCKEYGVKNPYNIEDNINGGVKYIKELLDKFNGNKQLALSAYNGGITRMRNRGVDTVQEIVKMPKETSDYVTKVMGYYNQYKEIKYV